LAAQTATHPPTVPLALRPPRSLALLLLLLLLLLQLASIRTPQRSI